MKRAWHAPLLLLVFVSGCHVVDRAQRCGKLAAIAKKAAPEIAATTIADSPPPKTLRKKAQLYGQLAENFNKVHFDDQVVDVARDGLVTNLKSVEQHLLEAAQALDAQEKFLERQSRVAARHEAILAEKRASGAELEETSGALTPPSPLPPPEPTKQPTGPRAPRGLPGFGPTTTQEGSQKGFSPPSLSARLSPHSYAYERAKRAIEAASRGVETASRNLENVCR